MNRAVSYTFEARPWTLNEERRGATHWSKRSEMVSQWREAFHWLARQRFVRFAYAHVIVDVAMKPPLADTGNCYGAVKAAIDGLVDAGVLPGDTPSHVLSIKMNAPIKVQKGEREFLKITLEGESL